MKRKGLAWAAGKKSSHETNYKHLRGQDRWRHHLQNVGGAAHKDAVRRGGLEASERCRDNGFQQRDKAVNSQLMRHWRAAMRKWKIQRWRRACLWSSGSRLKLSRWRRKRRASGGMGTAGRGSIGLGRRDGHGMYMVLFILCRYASYYVAFFRTGTVYSKQ